MNLVNIERSVQPVSYCTVCHPSRVIPGCFADQQACVRHCLAAIHNVWHRDRFLGEFHHCRDCVFRIYRANPGKAGNE